MADSSESEFDIIVDDPSDDESNDEAVAAVPVPVPVAAAAPVAPAGNDEDDDWLAEVWGQQSQHSQLDKSQALAAVPVAVAAPAPAAPRPQQQALKFGRGRQGDKFERLALSKHMLVAKLSKRYLAHSEQTADVVKAWSERSLNKMRVRPGGAYLTTKCQKRRRLDPGPSVAPGTD
jgi:hypothetical protein